MVTFVLPPIFPDKAKDVAPLAAVLFVTTYFKITMLPFAIALPTTPSPK
jgi:hypothetical protein